MQNRFVTAEEAFEYYYEKLQKSGFKGKDNYYLYDISFNILVPRANEIKTPFRKWSEKYAAREFNWYLSQDRNVTELAKHAPIWNKMHGGDGIVNSNYGWLWNRNDQLNKVIDKLRKNPETRQAVLTLYDGKDIDSYKYDTPCTISISFYIHDGSLNMSVLMRSNDLWYGFCNDQYCFSNLQILVAKELALPVGTYYHYAQNFHLYFTNCKQKIL